LEKSGIRVLTVDDHEFWRQFVASTLQTLPELQIAGEACDGLEGVQKSEELQPDLIIMDIGLPSLNGIEAARRIRKASTKPIILFLSENRSPEIAKEILRTCGSGYVVKSDAARELLPAVAAVLHGKQFISSTLAGNGLGASGERNSNHGGDKVEIAPKIKNSSQR
jgi:DNA-binding NarL/FixJ family response regulator